MIIKKCAIIISGAGKYLASNYLFANFLHPTLPGLFENNFQPFVNAALWTITIEVMFYLVVLFFAFESGAISKLLNRNVFQALGKQSYSIYLTHAAILFMVTSVALIGQRVLDKEIALMIGGHGLSISVRPFYNNVLVVSVLLIVILVSRRHINI